MKKLTLFLAAFAAACALAAQSAPLPGAYPSQPAVPPKFQGADVQRFMSRLIGEAEKVVLEKEIPASELTAHVAVAFKVDTAGRMTEWRFLDNTCPGYDHREIEPATERTREVLSEAAARLEAWTPAESNGLPVTYTYRLTLRLPVEKIARSQDGDPLLFMGADPDKTFHEWATVRTHYDRRFTARGVEGLVHVRFYIEPDGMITIGEVVRTPDEKLAREVVRVIKASRGKWTPRRKDGVPQRTAYDYRVNFHNDVRDVIED